MILKLGKRATGALYLIWAVLAALPPGPVFAGEAASEWADSDFSRVRLVSAVKAAGTAETVPLGLHFILKKGWKIYWRSPGDAGYPPRVDWSDSKNLAKAGLSWPIPERFSIIGLETMGYKDEVVLPVDAAPVKPGEPLLLRAAADYLACNEICIPIRVNLALDLPPGPPEASAFSHLISRFAARVPGDGSAHGINIESAGTLNRGKTSLLRVSASSVFSFVKPDMFVEGPQMTAFSPPKLKLSGGGKKALLEAAIDGLAGQDGGLTGKSLTITIADGQRFAEKTLVVTKAADKPGETLSWPLILVMAALGGLVLNLMPCVLPVLSLKLLGVISHGGGLRREVCFSFLATAAGIVFSFLVLAAILAALKQAGAMVGWGIQFQHPWFLAAMVMMVTLFACNLWGFFEARLPMWLADLGESSSHVHGLGGSFISGVLAMLLATPCSAPFLGTAIGFAFSLGLAEIFSIFMAIGIGLAFPFLLLALFPGLATGLPRPGPWMLALKKVLGFALAATGVWLLSVLAVQAGMAAAFIVGALAVLCGAALYVNHRLNGRFARPAAAAVFVLAALALWAPQGLSLGLSLAAAPPAVNSASGLDKLWKPFDAKAIPDLVASGKVVLVDVTADWCITCIVNKRFVLSKGEVFKRLASGSVLAMKADWTLPNGAISEYLASYGRYGIPFNAVYGPGAPDGLLLPELLSEGAVLDAFAKAAGS